MKAQKIKKGVYEVTFRINLNKLLVAALITAAIVGIAGLIFLMEWLLPLVWKGIVWLAISIWSVKWWLLGAAGLALLIWLLSKIKWPKRQPNKERNEYKERKFPWWWLLSLLAIAAIIFFLCRNCSGKESEPEYVVTPERYENADGWIILDTYLSEGLNVKYADYQKFPDYDFKGSLEERKEVFGNSDSYRDWREIFQFVKGRELNDNQLAAIIRYGLWNGLAGFEKSTICHKLQNGQKIEPEDFTKVYTKKGGVRQYTGNSATHVEQYAWVLAALYQGDISLEEILEMPVKSYEKISVEKMYTPQGKYISPSTEMKTKLLTGANPTTRKVLGL